MRQIPAIKLYVQVAMEIETRNWCQKRFNMFPIRNDCCNISTLSPENSKKILGKMVLADRCELFLEWKNELTRTFASNLEWSNDNRWVHTSEVSRQSLAGAKVHLRA